MKLSIGIDPGASGAIACYDGITLEVFDMPVVEVKRGTRTVRQTNAGMLASLICAARSNAEDAVPPSEKVTRLADYGLFMIETYATVEKVGAMPGQGVSSMFAFGRAAGVIEGVLAGLEIPTTLVPPQTWQLAMGIKGGGKDAARARAAQLFPVQAGLFARKMDDGRADATLIAVYAFQNANRQKVAA